jgi:hypothetical protein
MLKKVQDGDALSNATRWINDDHSVVIGAQVSHQNGKAFVHLGHPLLGTGMTEAEALEIAESFAETLAVLHSEMALALRTMRGAGKPVDPRTCPACLAKKARGGK